ncbi:hypothetical protein, partial [Leyella stercorea]|uniref:hypothetical protein n=1 Tax=Leyella stercorea TaxID=363265 RepID=UPI002FDB363B
TALIWEHRKELAAGKVTENNHNVTLSFFNSYFVIPNYASLSCLSAIVSHAFSAASSFISDAKVVLFVFAHKY